MHPDEVPTDVHLVRALVATQFPRWAGLPVSPVTSSGTDNAMFRLGPSLVARLPRIPAAVDNVAREQRWLPHLAPHLPVAVPVPVAHGEPAHGYPFPWSVLRWLDGENPSPPTATPPGSPLTRPAGPPPEPENPLLGPGKPLPDPENLFPSSKNPLPHRGNPPHDSGPRTEPGTKPAVGSHAESRAEPLGDPPDFHSTGGHRQSGVARGRLSTGVDEELARGLAGFVAALRAVDPAGGPESGRGQALVTRDEPTRAALARLGGEVDVARAARVWVDCLAVGPGDAAPAWCHGDLSPGNVLVRDGRLRAVIDFGGVGVGDPTVDLVVAWNLLSPAGREVFRAELEVDDATWERGRGWALSIALIQLPYYRTSNPALAANARHTISEALNPGR
ncbi:aminoglycoside phosphotransferase family protein [Actinokineospora sp. PR83]|uniref:aminoglycoside phosphotransferase family protein n=1 Tax=Actinokineospora sp. PR83 TaxID=2884908 RepID=UPI002107B163|nr:phosphotransferase [Actinokineospora sp. PR83]